MASPWPVPDLHPERRTGSQLALAVSTRVAELWSWAPSLDDARRVDDLHAMRLAAKRLRYLLDDCEPLLADGAGKPIKRLRQLQNALGAVHDCDVRIETLRALLAARGGRQRRQLERLVEGHDAGDPRLAEAAAALAASCEELPLAGLARLLETCVEERAARHRKLRKRFRKLDRKGLRRRLIELAA